MSDVVNEVGLLFSSLLCVVILLIHTKNSYLSIMFENLCKNALKTWFFNGYFETDDYYRFEILSTFKIWYGTIACLIR